MSSMRTIERDIVSAVIQSKDGKILQSLKIPGSAYAGYWCIQGGGIEEGESQRTALDRELLEEAGLDISHYTAELVHTTEGETEKTLKATGERVMAKMRFFTYRVVIEDKNADEISITLDDDEFSEYAWYDPSELRNLKLPPPSVELFTKLGYL